MFLRYPILTLVGLSLTAAFAAQAEPRVIPGVGPGQTEPYNQPYAAPQAAPYGEPMQAPAQSGGYGGGFLEMLMTGGSAPSRHDPAVAPGTHSYNGPANPASQMTAYADPEAAAPRREIDPIYLRQEVAYTGTERPGTIVVDTPNKFLFFVEPGGHALRYGIGVGRPGFAWSGVKTISRKAEWPDWTPPAEMLLRRPDLPTHMEGGPANPLGARALYLGSSLYRIHGTNEPYTIGTNVSSGCIRMMNQDVEDLYGRVRVGTKVIVM
jgi:lipoprotein-anchoring transpeptidase ErfK/SrfK